MSTTLAKQRIIATVILVTKVVSKVTMLLNRVSSDGFLCSDSNKLVKYSTHLYRSLKLIQYTDSSSDNGM